MDYSQLYILIHCLCLKLGFVKHIWSTPICISNIVYTFVHQMLKKNSPKHLGGLKPHNPPPCLRAYLVSSWSTRVATSLWGNSFRWSSFNFVYLFEHKALSWAHEESINQSPHAFHLQITFTNSVFKQPPSSLFQCFLSIWAASSNLLRNAGLLKKHKGARNLNTRIPGIFSNCVEKIKGRV